MTSTACGCRLRSDTARWFDVLHTLPAVRWAHVRRRLEQEHVPHWYATLRMDKERHEVNLDDLTPQLVEAADPNIDLTYRQDGPTYEGLYNFNGGRFTAHHSLEELLALRVTAWDGRWRQANSQPFTIVYTDGEVEHEHTPDYLLLPHDPAAKPLLLNVTLLERNENADRLRGYAVAHVVAKHRGWEYKVVKGQDLRALTIIRKLARARRQPWDPDGRCEEFLDLLSERPRQIKELANTPPNAALSRPVLHWLLWTRQVHMDLRERLSDETWLHG